MLLPNLPDHARVWIYQANRPFSESEATEITTAIHTFVQQWAAHKVKVDAEGQLLYNRFIVLGVDENMVGASGCSIDSSVHFIKQIGTQYGVDFFNRFQVAYIKDGTIESCGSEELLAKLNSGEVTDDTMVFNNLITTKAEMETNWQIPLKHSWIKRTPSGNSPLIPAL